MQLLPCEIEKRLTQACCPSHPRVRHGPASSPSVTAVGAPWPRIPEPSQYPPASSAPLPALAPAGAHGSIRPEEPALPRTPSTSAAFFPVCCMPYRLTARPHPLASPGSPSLGTIAPDVHAICHAYGHRRIDRSRSQP